jgi:hypothetical protein
MTTIEIRMTIFKIYHKSPSNARALVPQAVCGLPSARGFAWLWSFASGTVMDPMGARDILRETVAVQR